MIMVNDKGVERRVLGSLHGLWCFLFGWVYYAHKGLWGRALLSFLTMNGLMLFPFFNRGIVRRGFEDKGWIYVRD